MLLLLCWSIDSRAQDEVPGPDLNGITNGDPNSYDEKPLLLESEAKTSKSPSDTTSSRSPIIAPAKKTVTVPDAKKKEESDPLNFNFLFYIIQTFKSSDLMMEN